MGRRVRVTTADGRSVRRTLNKVRGRKFRDRLLEKQNWTCAACKNYVWKIVALRDMRSMTTNHSRGATVDHIIRVADGGKNSFENCQILCRECHQEKSNEENRRDQLR